MSTENASAGLSRHALAGQHMTGADIVVLFGQRPLGPSSRLALMPSERIARQLSVPVLTFPIPEVGPPDPDPGPTRRWPFQTGN